MKFDLSSVPDNVSGEVQVGDVFLSNGGRGNGRNFWVVVSVRGTMAHMLAVDRSGTIVGATSYGVHTFERRQRVGYAPEVQNITIPIAWDVAP
jgi:hypothetical protein